VFPWSLISDHSVEDYQEFAHTGGDNYFEFFALGSEASGKVQDGRIAPHGGQGGHVKQTADIFSTSPYTGLSCETAGAEVIRRYSYQGCYLLAVEQAEFRQLAQEHGTCLRSYSGRAADDLVFAAELLIGLNVFLDKVIESCNLVIKSLYHFAHACEHLAVTDHLLSVHFLGSQVGKLSASLDQIGQFFGFMAESGPWLGLDDFSEAGQDSGVNRVGLCDFADAACELAYLARRSNDDIEVSFEQGSGERTLIAAGGFHYDQFDLVRSECRYQLLCSGIGVGQRQTDCGWRRADTEGVFCYVNSYENLLIHGTLPILQMRARRTCGSSTAPSAVRAGPTAATRIPLRDGLRDLDTIDLSSPAACGSTRYARLAASRFLYGTFNHD
jgi:hypothetical protein